MDRAPQRCSPALIPPSALIYQLPDQDQENPMNAAPFTTHAVSSKDGTTIGYRQLGQRPGIVVLHGSMSSGYYHLELAEPLCDALTIHLPARPSRGLTHAHPTGP